MNEMIIEKLNEEFLKAKLRNPAISLRAFAKRLDMQASALSEILNGKRTITEKMGKRILDGLGLSEVEFRGDYSKEDIKLSCLDFKVISDWYFFAILSLAEIDDFSVDPIWIAKRLNISQKDAKNAVRILIKKQMLIEENGRFRASHVNFSTPTEIRDLSIKQHTLQSLELARDSLLEDPIDSRDFSTITMAIDPEKIPEAKLMISKFRKKLMKKLESGKKKEVYKLAIQLFPLTKIGGLK